MNSESVVEHLLNTPYGFRAPGEESAFVNQQLAFLRHKFFGVKTSLYVNMDTSPMLKDIDVGAFLRVYILDERVRCARA